MKKPRVGLAFMAVGFAFIAIGVTGNRAFLGVGVVFVILGLVQRRRQRNNDQSPLPTRDVDGEEGTVSKKP